MIVRLIKEKQLSYKLNINRKNFRSSAGKELRSPIPCLVRISVQKLLCSAPALLMRGSLSDDSWLKGREIRVKWLVSVSGWTQPCKAIQSESKKTMCSLKRVQSFPFKPHFHMLYVHCPGVHFYQWDDNHSKTQASRIIPPASGGICSPCDPQTETWW